MVSWRQFDVDVYESRQGKKPAVAECGDETTESKIQSDIESYCVARGWLVVRQRMDKKTTTAKGTADLIIAMTGGVTWWVECKRKGGKQTTEQLAHQMHLKRLGHNHAVVHSLKEFVEKTMGL